MMQWLDSLLARKSRQKACVLEQVEEDVRAWVAGTMSTITFSHRVAGLMGMEPGRIVDPEAVQRILGRWRLKRLNGPMAEESIRELYEPVVIRTGGQHTPEVQT